MNHTMTVTNPDGTTSRIKKPLVPECWSRSIVEVVAELLEDIREHDATATPDDWAASGQTIQSMYGSLARELQYAEDDLSFYVEKKLPRNGGDYPIHNRKSRRMQADLKKAEAMADEALGLNWFRSAR
jgi:hypothetical protein